MKIISSFIIVFFIYQFCFAQYQFVSPLPGSSNLPVEHNIIIRPGYKLDPTSVQASLFSIQGSKSGTHSFKPILCADGKTINLNPLIPFAFNETVSVSIANGLMTMEGTPIASFAFNFTTHREWTDDEKKQIESDRQLLVNEEASPDDEEQSDTRDIEGMFTITANNNPAPGLIFFDARLSAYMNSPYNAISVIDNNGDSVFQRMFNTLPFDFQKSKNGYFDTYQNNIARFLVMDSNFAVIDTYLAVNGYFTDPHELQMLPNGYAFLVANDPQLIMVQVNDSTLEQKDVTGSVIQELDPNHDIVFEWRSFDHVAIEEDTHINYSANVIDYIHTNSIELDTDENIIVSHRNIDQVTKIDINTGEFIWRLGGVYNEFTFTNDSDMFSHQHDCRRLANGNITMYDDGNFHVPAKSFAKEYTIDEANMTVTLAWSYSHPDVNGHVAAYSAMGSMQRLSNGNTLIDWGWRTYSTLPSITEVDSSGNIVWEIKMLSANNLISYRAHKYVWEPCARPTFNALNTSDITSHSAHLAWVSVSNPSQIYEIQYKKHVDSVWLYEKVNASQYFLDLTGLEPATEYDWRIQSWCDTVSGIASHFTSILNFTTLLATSATETGTDEFSMYPNPADDAIHINCGFRISQIRIMNLLGQRMMTFFVNDDASAQNMELPVSNLSTGNYVVEIIGESRREVRKLTIE